MSKKKLSTVILLVLAIMLGLATTTGLSYAADKPIKWKGQSCFGLAGPLAKYAIVLWRDKLNAMAGGRLVVDLHEPNAIVPPNKVYDAVRDGVLDCGMNTPAWQMGKYPAGDLFYTLPGGVLEFNDLIIWMYGGGGLQMEREMYGKEIVVLPLGLTPPEEVWTKKPVKTLADMKGKKVRSAGLSMELWRKLGASVVLLPGGEVVPSLQRGMVDSAEFCDASMDYTLGIHEVCKYRFGPPVHMSNNIFQLVINPKSWNKLPDDLKAIVENAAMAATFEGYAKHWIDAIDANAKFAKLGVTTMKLSKEDQAKTREIAMQVIEERSKKDPYFAKVWAAQKAFIDKFRPYYELTSFD
jgi:TRAP-type mannitol/chloroaromatic compound transport system substrate-binding protein